MKITTSTKVTIGIVIAQLITLIVELFVTNHHTIFVTFVSIGCFILFIYFCQWIAFKSINSQLRRNKIRKSNTDARSVEMFIDRKSDGDLTVKEIVAARRLRGWLLIYTLLIPLLISIVLGITFAFV